MPGTAAVAVLTRSAHPLGGERNGGEVPRGLGAWYRDNRPFLGQGTTGIFGARVAPSTLVPWATRWCMPKSLTRARP
jgi:hypothetical protein